MRLGKILRIKNEREKKRKDLNSKVKVQRMGCCQEINLFYISKVKKRKSVKSSL